MDLQFDKKEEKNYNLNLLTTNSKDWWDKLSKKYDNEELAMQISFEDYLTHLGLVHKKGFSILYDEDHVLHDLLCASRDRMVGILEKQKKYKKFINHRAITEYLAILDIERYGSSNFVESLHKQSTKHIKIIFNTNPDIIISKQPPLDENKDIVHEG